MSLKTSVLFLLLAASGACLIAGCDKPGKTEKPATSAPPEGPTAHTTESK